MKSKKIELLKDNSIDNEELPEGWEEAPLLELCELIRGVSYTKGEESHTSVEGFVPLLRANNIDRELKFKDLYYIPERFVKPKQYLQQGDALFAMSSGSKSVVGKAATVKQPFDGTFGTFCGVLRPSNKVDWKFFGYFFQTKYYRDRISEASAGVNINNLKREYFEAINFPLPPISEQQRIVARVEALLSHINAAREPLSRVPLIMKKFRQAVLAAACSGRLTEGGREEEKNLVTAADLYNRIQTIRMKKYEQAVIETKKLKKRIPPKPSFLENCEPDSGTTTEIPDEWIWKKVVNLGPFGEDTVKTGPFGAILKSKEFVSSGIPIIAIGNVQWGKFDLNGARVDHVTEEKASELENYRVRTGDVLFTRSGTIGRSLVVPDFADHWLMSYHLLRVRADPNLIIPQYLYFVFAGCESSKEYTSDATIGSTRPGINTTILENVPVPLPPLAEQHEIVRRVGLLFERADAFDLEVVAAGRRCERLTQAVLGKAFAGKL